MKKIIQQTDLSNAQKLDLILNTKSSTPDRVQKLPNLNRTIDVGQEKKQNQKANLVSDYMNRFNKSAERQLRSEIDYNDTKSVVKNIRMKRKKFIPPEKEEIRR